MTDIFTAEQIAEASRTRWLSYNALIDSHEALRAAKEQREFQARQWKERWLAAEARVTELETVIPGLISYALGAPSNQASFDARDDLVLRARAVLAGES